MTISLYEHNQEAYEKTIKMLERSSKAAIIHPTGSGKSFIVFKIIEHYDHAKFLWLGPSEHVFFAQTQQLNTEEMAMLSRVEFMTYAKVFSDFNNNIIGEQSDYDYIILDEFHRIGAAFWGRSVFELINNAPEAKLIGLSATSIRYLDNGRDMGKEIFGDNIASKISLTEAIQRKILPAPNYVISLYEPQEFAESLERQSEKISDKRIRERNITLCKKLRGQLENANGIDVILKKHIANQYGKYIVFCLNVDHLYTMISQVPLWFKDIDRHPHVYYLVYESRESHENLKNFLQDDSNHIKLLFCVDMLNEGIHIPGTDGVILLRHTRSPIVYKQQIGRTLSAGMTGTPVIFDFVNNIYDLSITPGYREDYYKELQTLDQEDELENVFNITDELASFRGLLEKIQNNFDTAWERFYFELKNLYLQEKNINLMADYVTEDGLELGKWTFAQRYFAKSGRLSERKIKKLNEIGFSWESNSKIKYDYWIQELTKYKETFGDVNVRVGYKTPDGAALGNWLKNVKGAHNRQELPDEYVEDLEELGVVWNAREEKWKNAYRHAKDYYLEYGDLIVPEQYVSPDGFKLGQWLAGQLCVFRGKHSGYRTDERLKLLEEIGFSYESDRLLKEQLRELDIFYEAHGNLNIPPRYVTEDGFELGQWVRHQKDFYSSGQMGKERIVALCQHHMDEWGLKIENY